MTRLLIALAVVVGLWLLMILVLIASGRRSKAHEIATFIPDLVVLFRGLLRDPRVPRGSKVWLWVGLIWIVSPIDLIPEFIPVAGPLDDAIVAFLVLRRVLRSTERRVLSEHWRGTQHMLELLQGVVK